MGREESEAGVTGAAARAALCRHATTLPEAWEDHPWGETVVKVRSKVFVFLGSGETFGLSVKLPHSGFEALLLPFTAPTGYGLGKSGWVSARFGPDEAVPLSLLRAWIEESYRAVAPRTLVRLLDAPRPELPREPDGGEPPPAPRRRKA